MRLLHLHLRSRRAGWALGFIVVSVIVTWFGLREFYESRSQLVFAAIVLPLLPAVVIGGSAWSPFGEPEIIAGGRLPVLRLSHLGGLLVLAGLGLALVSTGSRGGDMDLALTRNLAGYAGLAFIGARLLGGGIGWLVPLGYATIALTVDASTRLGWAQRIPVDLWSITVAAVLLTAGLSLSVLRGAKINPADDT